MSKEIADWRFFEGSLEHKGKQVFISFLFYKIFLAGFEYSESDLTRDRKWLLKDNRFYDTDMYTVQV